jgi:hypothetical protein
MPQLAPGDIVNVITFDRMVKIEREGAVYAESAPQAIALDALTRRLHTRQRMVSLANATEALALAYRVARRHHAPDRWSQIVLLTGHPLSRGTVVSKLIVQHLAAQGDRGIRLAIAGIGTNWQEESHRALSSLGKSSHARVLTFHDAAKLMSGALVGPAAREIRFRLDYPDVMEHTSPSLYGGRNDASMYLPYNEDHYMFESFRAPDDLDVSAEMFELQISYIETNTGELAQLPPMRRAVAEMLGRSADNLRVAEAIHLFTALLAQTIDHELVDAILGSYSDQPDAPVFHEYVELIGSLP